MSSIASIERNLMVVGLATAAGVLFLVAAVIWKRGHRRHAAIATAFAAAVTAIFVVQLLSL